MSMGAADVVWQMWTAFLCLSHICFHEGSGWFFAHISGSRIFFFFFFCTGYRVWNVLNANIQSSDLSLTTSPAWGDLFTWEPPTSPPPHVLMLVVVTRKPTFVMSFSFCNSLSICFVCSWVNISQKKLEILSCLFSVGLRVGWLVYAMAYVWRSEDNLQESDLSFYHVGSGVEPRLSRLTASTLG